MIVKELIDKLKEYSGDLFVITQTSHYEHDYDFSFPIYSVVTDVYIEDDSFVALSNVTHKASVIKPMTVKEVINELSKYSSNLINSSRSSYISRISFHAVNNFSFRTLGIYAQSIVITIPATERTIADIIE